MKETYFAFCILDALSFSAKDMCWNLQDQKYVKNIQYTQYVRLTYSGINMKWLELEIYHYHKIVQGYAMSRVCNVNNGNILDKWMILNKDI